VNPPGLKCLGFDQPNDFIAEKHFVMNHVFLESRISSASQFPVTGISNNAGRAG